ncbi:hypothetical protein V2J09_010438 [Rumex salicifolius]
MYEENVLYGIAAALGNPVKLDINTLNATRGKFAHVCIEIDITQPLLGAIMVEGKKVFIEYEGLHMVCYRCGVFGHLVDICPHLNPRQNMGEQEMSNNDENLRVKASTSTVVECPAAKRNVGAWSVVTPKPRRGQTGPKASVIADRFVSKNNFENLVNLEEYGNVDLGELVVTDLIKDIPLPPKSDLPREMEASHGPSGGSQRGTNKGPNKKGNNSVKRAKTDVGLDSRLGRVTIANQASPCAANSSQMAMKVLVQKSNGVPLQLECPPNTTFPKSQEMDVDMQTRVLNPDVSMMQEEPPDPGNVVSANKSELKIGDDMEVIVDDNAHFIHARVQLARNSYHLVIVYGPPTPLRRVQFWKDIDSTIATITEPCFIGGDFNVIIDLSERRGGSGGLMSNSGVFSDLISPRELIDMGFSGSNFTWHRGPAEAPSVSKRLDRFLMNVSARIAWCGLNRVVKKGARWRVGDGCRVRFWSDKWLDDRPLSEWALGNLDQNQLEREKEGEMCLGRKCSEKPMKEKKARLPPIRGQIKVKIIESLLKKIARAAPNGGKQKLTQIKSKSLGCISGDDKRCFVLTLITFASGH